MNKWEMKYILIAWVVFMAIMFAAITAENIIDGYCVAHAATVEIAKECKNQ